MEDVALTDVARNCLESPVGQRNRYVNRDDNRQFLKMVPLAVFALPMEQMSAAAPQP